MYTPLGLRKEGEDVDGDESFVKILLKTEAMENSRSSSSPIYESLSLLVLVLLERKMLLQEDTELSS
jgi:hypothetical protein